MTTSNWPAARLAAVAAIAIAACAHGERGGSAAQQTAAQRPQTPAEQAAQTEGALARAQQRLVGDRQAAAQAEQQRTQARQQLSESEQRLSQSRQRLAEDQRNVHQLEGALADQRARAEEAAVQAQIQAEQAQGLRLVSGRIAEASPQRIVLEDERGRTMQFQVDPRTRVLVGTEQRSVSDLQQGADARVAYDPREEQPAAVAVHVAPAREQQQAPPPAAPAQR